MGLAEVFEKLKKNKWVWAIYIPLTIPLNVFLALSGNCLALIMVGLLTFGIPYFFGVRSIKTLLIVGIVIILLTGVIFGILYTHFMYNESYYPYFEDRYVSDTDLENGIVLPYRGHETASFNYTVRYKGSESPENIMVYANITDLQLDFEKNIPLMFSNGVFYNETILGKDIYTYHFALYINTTGEWLETDSGFGPLTVPYSETQMNLILTGILSLFLNSGVFFFMFIALYYWRKSAQEQRKRWAEELKTAEDGKEKSREKKAKKKEEKDKGEFTCTSCNATVDAEAEKCWKCGEEFTGVEEGEKEEEKEVKGDKKEKPKEEFECTSCGADVSADATSCPNCGEPFKDEGEEDKEQKKKEEAKGEFTCTSCGADVTAEANYCPNCGEPFEDNEEEDEKLENED